MSGWMSTRETRKWPSSKRARRSSRCSHGLRRQILATSWPALFPPPTDLCSYYEHSAEERTLSACGVRTQPAGPGTNVVRYLARHVSTTAINDKRMIADDDVVERFASTDTSTHAQRECRPAPRTERDSAKRAETQRRPEAKPKVRRAGAGPAGGKSNNSSAAICSTCSRRASTACAPSAGCTRPPRCGVRSSTPC